MTSETHTFIEFADLTAIRIECPNCHTQTVARLDTDAGRDQAGSLVGRYQCPMCKDDWSKGAKNGRIAALEQLLEALLKLQKYEGTAKPRVTLELATPK